MPALLGAAGTVNRRSAPSSVLALLGPRRLEGALLLLLLRGRAALPPCGGRRASGLLLLLGHHPASQWSSRVGLRMQHTSADRPKLQQRACPACRCTAVRPGCPCPSPACWAHLDPILPASISTSSLPSSGVLLRSNSALRMLAAAAACCCMRSAAEPDTALMLMTRLEPAAAAVGLSATAAASPSLAFSESSWVAAAAR